MVAGGAALWGHFEAGWVRLRTLEVPLQGLPAELAGLRIAHLSDRERIHRRNDVDGIPPQRGESLGSRDFRSGVGPQGVHERRGLER